MRFFPSIACSTSPQESKLSLDLVETDIFDGCMSVSGVPDTCVAIMHGISLMCPVKSQKNQRPIPLEPLWTKRARVGSIPSLMESASCGCDSSHPFFVAYRHCCS